MTKNILPLPWTSYPFVSLSALDTDEDEVLIRRADGQPARALFPTGGGAPSALARWDPDAVADDPATLTYATFAAAHAALVAVGGGTLDLIGAGPFTIPTGVYDMTGIDVRGAPSANGAVLGGVELAFADGAQFSPGPRSLRHLHVTSGAGPAAIIVGEGESLELHDVALSQGALSVAGSSMLRMHRVETREGGCIELVDSIFVTVSESRILEGAFSLASGTAAAAVIVYPTGANIALGTDHGPGVTFFVISSYQASASTLADLPNLADFPDPSDADPEEVDNRPRSGSSLDYSRADHVHRAPPIQGWGIAYDVLGPSFYSSNAVFAGNLLSFDCSAGDRSLELPDQTNYINGAFWIVKQGTGGNILITLEDGSETLYGPTTIIAEHQIYMVASANGVWIVS